MWRLVSLAVILLPTFVSADRADLGRFTRWILETSHTVLFYDGKTPLARVEIPYCEVTPLSAIRLFNSYVCDSDEVMVNGVACRIITVEKLY
jgi:hypothetical protein